MSVYGLASHSHDNELRISGASDMTTAQQLDQDLSAATQLAGGSGLSVQELLTELKSRGYDENEAVDRIRHAIDKGEIRLGERLRLYAVHAVNEAA